MSRRDSCRRQGCEFASAFRALQTWSDFRRPPICGERPQPDMGLRRSTLHAIRRPVDVPSTQDCADAVTTSQSESRYSSCTVPRPHELTFASGSSVAYSLKHRIDIFAEL